MNCFWGKDTFSVDPRTRGGSPMWEVGVLDINVRSYDAPNLVLFGRNRTPNVISVHGASRTLPCLRPVRQTLHLTAASPSHQRPQCCSGSATSPSLSSALQCQGSHTTTPASPHCAFMCIQGFRFMDVGQPLICRLFRRTAVRTLGKCELSPLPLSHHPILRSTSRFPSR